jgi:uncharacterized protein YcsI (UPF0317 family)
VHRNGPLADERTDIVDLWRDDFVAFLMDCSFSSEHLLLDAGLLVRNVGQKINGPMYMTTSIACRPGGSTASWRVDAADAARVGGVSRGDYVGSSRSSRRPGAHRIASATWHFESGQTRLGRRRSDGAGRRADVLGMWSDAAAGAMEAGIDLMISHATGHML